MNQAILHDQALLALLVNLFLILYPTRKSFYRLPFISRQHIIMSLMNLLSDCCCHTVFVEQISCGKKNVLTVKDPYQLGVTSGTSGKSSLLPTTSDVGKIFFTNGVLVGISAMFDAYPGVKETYLSLS